MKIVFLYNTSEYLFRFRSELVQELIQRGHSIYVIAPKDKWSKKVTDLGCVYFPWRLRSQSINPLDDILSLFQLFLLLLRVRPNMIFSFTVKPVLFASFLRPFLPGCILVSMITGRGSIFSSGDGFRAIVRQLTCLVYKLLVNNNSVVFFQNQEDLNYFVEKLNLCKEKAIRINGSGVSVLKFRPGTERKPQSFLMVSRLIRQKGVYEFIEAARRVRSEFPGASFHLVGAIDGSPDAIDRQFLEKAVMEKVITYYGFVDNVLPLMQSIEVFVLPSYYPEGVPRSILEAMSVGMPIITTDWPGCRDTVKVGVNGYIVVPRRVDALVDVMISLIRQPDVVRVMGPRSREMALDRFSVDKVNCVILNSLSRLMQNKKSVMFFKS
jgi:glycosyltransferase involved in cell wall biosynthesis